METLFMSRLPDHSKDIESWNMNQPRVHIEVSKQKRDYLVAGSGWPMAWCALVALSSSLHGWVMPMNSKIQIHLPYNRRGGFAKQVVRHLPLCGANLSPCYSVLSLMEWVFTRTLPHTFSLYWFHADLLSVLLAWIQHPPTWEIAAECSASLGKQKSELVLCRVVIFAQVYLQVIK